MRINLLHYPVLTLGPYDRVGIWLQGCSIRCKGCMSKHTWSFSGGYEIDVEVLQDKVLSYGCKRISISGGEPLDQFSELLMFLKLITPKMEDILLYTGYDVEVLNNQFREIYSLVDVIVAGPFIRESISKSRLKGSDNQKVLILKSDFEKVYGEYEKGPTIMQIYRDTYKNYIIGVPEKWEW